MVILTNYKDWAILQLVLKSKAVDDSDFIRLINMTWDGVEASLSSK
jgi:hypothetical protein